MWGIVYAGRGGLLGEDGDPHLRVSAMYRRIWLEVAQDFLREPLEVRLGSGRGW